MELETIYFATLTDVDSESTFEVSPVDDINVQKLVVNNVYLGAEAKEGEYNVVEIEIQQVNGEKFKIPIAVLKSGETRSLKPNVEFKEQSVIFRLIQGKGPVHIIGRHICLELEMDEEESGMEQQSGEEEDFDEVVQEQSNKPQANGKTKRKK